MNAEGAPRPLAETGSRALQTLIAANADAILVVDLEGTVLLANPAAEELFGAAAEKLAGAPFGRPLADGDTTEIEVRRPGSPPRTAEMRVVEIEWEGRAACLASLREVTERKRIAERVGYIAQALQESLLPLRLPEIPGVEVAAYYRPAGEGHLVGGDFYDVFEIDDARWAVIVGDVRGKGPHAAGVTALARYTLRAAAVHKRRPSRILKMLNDAILRQRTDNEDFCTVAYGRLELVHGAGARLTLSIGGHPLPLLLRADGSVEPAGRAGTLLGITQTPNLVDRTVELRPGDALVLYTDGLLDAYAPCRALGDTDVVRLVESCAGLNAGGIAEHIHNAALHRADIEPRDDVALLVLRIATDTGKA
ncbi:MAG: phosphoserine phosphatase RsbU/P [Solirubrobacteraceae bacterium]|nr:phosphoserine phosphatase RsbU/P [Solirubrobacteraceae bacterium]